MRESQELRCPECGGRAFGSTMGATYLFAVRLGRWRERARGRLVFIAASRIVFGGTLNIVWRGFEEEITTEHMQEELKQLMEEREEQRR